MKQFKKRALALVLASVVTVVGAFGAENYTNTLMSLKFDSDNNNGVNVTLFTKRNYTKPITTYKKDANTYVIMLAETDGRSTPPPEISGNVSNVNISTMPYTTNGQGYTKITINTISGTILTTKSALYIEKKDDTDRPPTKPETSTTEKKNISNTFKPEKISEAKHEDVTVQDSVKQFMPPAQPAKNSQANVSEQQNNNIEQTEQPAQNLQTQNPENTEEEYDSKLLLYGILIVIFVCVLIIVHSKNKMKELVGDHNEFSFDENPEDKKPKKTKLKQTINKLDKMYEKPVTMSINFAPTADMPDVVSDEFNNEQENVVVDLDELFEENETDYNSALDDFLSDFSVSDENVISVQEQELDEHINEMFEKYIKSGVVTFSEDDIERIEKLLNSEINDDTLRNIEKYAVHNPIEPAKISPKEKLENLITEYTVNQNLSFSKDDVDALDKLVQVEIDKNFVEDLTTNPERTKQMQQEIESRQVSHKKSEILTLSVKDMLPDLSEALKQQGNKRIESEVKPQVVYYSEGYDVETLSVKDELPDIVLDFDNPEYNKYRPSDEVALADTEYEVETLAIKDELPDLKDVAEHPNKYIEHKEKVKVDEDALLKNIANVTFKPFYDGNEALEISEKFESETEENDEFNSKKNIFDENPNIQNDDVSETSVTEELPVLEKTKAKINIKPDKNTKDLLDIIEQQRKARREQKLTAGNVKERVSVKPKVEESTHPQSITYEGENYEILCNSKISENTGCYLAEGKHGFYIFGYTDEKITKLKYYDKIQSKRVQIRLNEKLEDGASQYIVRCGLRKFILNVKDGDMEYVMELC